MAAPLNVFGLFVLRLGFHALYLIAKPWYNLEADTEKPNPRDMQVRGRGPQPLRRTAVDKTSLARPAHDPTPQQDRWPAIRERATRGLLAYNAGCVLRLAGDAWIVRGTDPGPTDRVDLAAETCTCEDFTHYGRENDVCCKHLIACAIAHATRRGPRQRREDRPCACVGGWVYIGHVVERDGEEVEVYDRVPCRRCRAGAHGPGPTP
jgi:hypothetical protein